MQLITNKNKTHKSIFHKLLKKAHSIDIVTSYADSETVDFILKRLSKNDASKVRMIIGGNFAITDPETLETLKRALPGLVYLSMPADPVVFQSNIYLFKTKNNYHLLIGTATCTLEGMEENRESSVYMKSSKKSKLWKSAVKEVSSIIESDEVHILTSRILARYETYFEDMMEDPESSASSWLDNEVLINRMNELKTRFKKWKKIARNSENTSEIHDNYRLARKLLNRMASNEMISEGGARKHLNQLIGTSGEQGYWNVNGLQGSKAAIVEQFEVFREMIRFVRKNRDEAPGYVFEGCQEYSKKIKGVGVNMISEIMITYEPKCFAKLNSALISILIDPGALTLKKSVAKYSGNDYQKFTEIVRNYASWLGMKSLVELDLFFSTIMDELTEPIILAESDVAMASEEGVNDITEEE